MTDLASRLEDSILGDTPLSFDSPESSLVLAAAYSPGDRLLSVTLRAGKLEKTYGYSGFPPSQWVEFYQADSKGQYFSHHIRPNFSGTVR